MIDCVYYNDVIRCYRDGCVERWFNNCYWRIVENTDNSNGYNVFSIGNKLVRRHRLLAFCFLGLENLAGSKGGDDVIDHIDKNRLNNAVNNLRITTQQGNAQNTDCKGYSLDKERGKFEANIGLNGKKIHLGFYMTAEEARQAYLDGKIKYHLLLPQ